MPKQNSAIDQFLTPEAMLTPGIAGALTMMIANALAVNFHAPRAWTGLVVSFLFGLLVLTTDKRFLVKSALYVLNSLVIFCVAVGANGLGAAPDAGHAFRLLPSAFAETADGSGAASALHAEYDRLSAEFASLGIAIDQARKGGAAEADIAKLTRSRDEVDRKRQDLFKQVVAAEAAKSSPRIRQDSSKQFFAPWRF